MGVPALFRWLSRKYPKIVVPVIEEQPELIPGMEGEEMSEIPVDITKANPNGHEVDNLYLDMNGIVHPCTHPEGKPAPKTEQAMMIEVFKYTERVVNMTRPRKVLLIAIDGVAPRAKMNQQRSRRFRSAEEAKTKAKEREEAIKEWEALGKIMTDEYKNEKAWDSNAITPGTPFMDLLALSLRYWVAYKMNTDKGWDGLQVIISDASVPGEGEHKIMDYVRRQRSQPGYNPNTNHVFYGLDADLIMLSLATHEPNFKILREDVFAQAAKRGCHKCGQPGHHSSNCQGIPPEKKQEAEDATKSSPLKPFIFLDVSILREYLQVELDVPGLSFAFNLERAIDDWVFMIFFVGNDFLPHLPSLDIREGAIDMLLKIWRDALPLMGGYLVDNGKFELARLQLIMDGLSSREDEIFRKRRQAEERQNSIDQEKRRRIEGQSQRFGNNNNNDSPNGRNKIAADQHDVGGIPYVAVGVEKRPTDSPSSNLTATAPPYVPQAKPIVPPKPKNPMFVSSARGPSGAAPIRGGFINPNAANGAKANGSAPTPTSSKPGSPGKDVVNRAAIRKANLSAAEMLRAELAGGKNSAISSSAASASSSEPSASVEDVKPVSVPDEVEASAAAPGVPSATSVEDSKPGNSEEETEATAKSEEDMDTSLSVQPSAGDAIVETKPVTAAIEPDGTMDVVVTTPPAAASDVEEDVPPSAVNGEGAAVSALKDAEASDDTPRGKKRSADEAEMPSSRSQAEGLDTQEGNGDVPTASSSSDEDSETEAAPKAHVPKPLKMLGGNMVEQEDTVKLWEAGYKERYYEQKFGVKLDDVEFRRACAKSYVEGLSWVLAYYYNGCPSWTWFYPHHFAPFASDFTDVASMEINFVEGKPFRPFEQLMGVFPAASKVHIPKPFQSLMTDEDSEIIDFYPEEFHVDMNGKKMLWQGVALLPFIEEKRLLDAMAKRYPELTEEEVRRNGTGKDAIMVSEENPLYNQICSLYMKRKVDEPVPMDTTLSKGVRGTIFPNDGCIPNSTFDSPLTSEGLPDIQNDKSITAFYEMPSQAVPHKSYVLPGYKPVRRVLTPEDVDKIHRGISGEDGGGYRRGAAGDGFHSQRRNLEGPGFANKRDARNVVDTRRHSGNYSGSERYSNDRQGGYGTPDANTSYESDRGSYYGGSATRDPYAGYKSNYNSNNNSGYNSPSQSYGSSYGGRGYNAPPQQPPPPASYGGYGQSSYGQPSSYGSYGSTAPPAPYQAPHHGHQPPYYPPAPAAPQSYGSYGSYGAPPAPYQPPPPQQPGYGYTPPPPAGGAPYGGYGGYGQAPAPQPYQPPPQQAPYSNRGAILPPHLQNQGAHTRWGQ